MFTFQRGVAATPQTTPGGEDGQAENFSFVHIDGTLQFVAQWLGMGIDVKGLTVRDSALPPSLRCDVKQTSSAPSATQLSAFSELSENAARLPFSPSPTRAPQQSKTLRISKVAATFLKEELQFKLLL